MPSKKTKQSTFVYSNGIRPSAYSCIVVKRSPALVILQKFSTLSYKMKEMILHILVRDVTPDIVLQV